jgi:hypothetical protein
MRCGINFLGDQRKTIWKKKMKKKISIIYPETFLLKLFFFQNFFFRFFPSDPQGRFWKKSFFHFSVQGSDGGGLFAYIFGIYIKFGYNNPPILTPFASVDIAR